LISRQWGGIFRDSREALLWAPAPSWCPNPSRSPVDPRVSAQELPASPVFEAKSEEKFNGCIDIEGDRSCKGDPSGKLKFKFRYWASFADGDALHLGTCAHRIVKAKGGPTGASGFLMMVDIPISSRPAFRTHCEGVIRLGDSRHRPATPQRGVGSC